ncbi:hypothetical protein AB205_0112230 [Aquarana catesbeiana]|uniref:Uncharacterized protein n=1 Tax=Aquarana catesbeiana TaxID=8400 RepID=A0A2G9Q427_AQUCT|nr:hypothetical protein AB205_0112230 [Aquarana catesbeiana]
MRETTLTCQITNFRKRKIQINVYFKRRTDVKQHLIASGKSRDNNPHAPFLVEEVPEYRILPVEMEVEMTTSCIGMHKCLCSITITPDKETDDKALLVVEVEQAALKWPISVHRTLNVYEGDKPSLWRRWNMQVNDRISNIYLACGYICSSFIIERPVHDL